MRSACICIDCKLLLIRFIETVRVFPRPAATGMTNVPAHHSTYLSGKYRDLVKFLSLEAMAFPDGIPGAFLYWTTSRPTTPPDRFSVVTTMSVISREPK